jgi:RNA recognition motif-containing protein
LLTHGLTDCSAVKDKRYAFLRLRSEEDVARALLKADNLVLPSGETMPIKKANVRVREYTVFIGNLPYNTGDDVMQEMFDELLGVDHYKRVYVGKDNFGRPKGFAFGIFSNPSDAKRAIAVLNGLELFNRIIRAEKGVTRTVRDGKGGRKFKSSDEMN